MEPSTENKSSIKNKILKEKEFKNSEFIAAIVVNIIILYIVNNLLSWKISFIAPTFTEVLFILNLSIIANILANIGFLIYQKGWFRSLVQVILNIIGLVVAYSFYVVFPFVFKSVWITYSLKFALLVAIVVMIIATLVEIARFILRYVIKVET